MKPSFVALLQGITLSSVLVAGSSACFGDSRNPPLLRRDAGAQPAQAPDAGLRPADGGQGEDAGPEEIPGPVDTSSLTGKLLFGYQGWFGAAGDGSAHNRWRHWSPGLEPNADNITFDMWPDLREFDDDERFETGFAYAGGEPAPLFSSSVEKTVHRHMRWLQDYGLDGIFLQQFVVELRPDTAMRRTRDLITDHVSSGALATGRVFALMYDISGAGPDRFIDDLKNHWMDSIDRGLLDNRRYLHHRGRPLVAIWGLGFGDRPGEAEAALNLVAWFHSEAPEAYRASVMGGVPTGWRQLTGDSKREPAWAQYYRSLDVISPWTVGRFADDAGVLHHRRQQIEPDLIAAQQAGADYLPVIFPGFSWANLRPGAVLNQIPRRGGRFWWSQFHQFTEAGASMVYGAMFDEVDEATAMFKIAENARQTPTAGRFVTLDADGEQLPSDWYLRLAGEATKVLRGQRRPTANRPIHPDPRP